MASGRIGRALVSFAPVSVSASGDNTIVAASAGKRIEVLSYALSNAVATAQAVTWKSGGSSSLSGAMALPSSVGGQLVFAGTSNEAPGLATASGQALVLNLSAATAVTGHVAYIAE